MHTKTPSLANQKGSFRRSTRNILAAAEGGKIITSFLENEIEIKTNYYTFSETWASEHFFF